MQCNFSWISLLIFYMVVEIQCEMSGTISRSVIQANLTEMFDDAWAEGHDFTNAVSNNTITKVNQTTFESAGTIEHRFNSPNNESTSNNTKGEDDETSNDFVHPMINAGVVSDISSVLFSNLDSEFSPMTINVDPDAGIMNSDMSGIVMNAPMSNRDYDYDDGDHQAHDQTHYGVFHFSLKTVILLGEWSTSHWQSMLWSCGIIVAISIMFEGLKSGTERLTRYQKVQAMTLKSSKCCGICLHFTQTILHVIYFGVSYALMLIFMTFNGYLCSAVLMGNGIGYFIFNYKSSSSFSTDLTSM